MSKKKSLTPNVEIMRDSYIYALREAYKDYKREYKKSIDMTLIGKDGKWCVCGDGNRKNKEEAIRKLRIAWENYNRFMRDKGEQ